MARLLSIAMVAGLLGAGYVMTHDSRQNIAVTTSTNDLEKRADDRNKLIVSNLKHELEQAAALQNTLAGALAVVAAVCTTTKQVQCSAITSIFSGTAWLGSALAAQATLDLDKIDFTEIATPNGSTIDLSRVPPTTRYFVSGVITTISLTNAICETSRRALAASKAGNPYWERKQIQALIEFEAQLDIQIEQLSKAVAVTNIPSLLSTKIRLALVNYKSDTYKWGDQIKNDAESALGRQMLSCLWQKDAGLAGYAHHLFCKSVGAVLADR